MSPHTDLPQRVADAGAVISVTAAGWSWTTANEIAQFVAACFAIISGVAAGAYHIRKYMILRGEHNANRQNAKHGAD